MARHLILSLLTTLLFSSLGQAGECLAPTPNPSYCRENEWKNDALVGLMGECKPYASYVCTQALQYVVIRPGTTSTRIIGGPTSTAKAKTTTTSTQTNQRVITTTKVAAEKTVTESKPIATVTSHDQTASITVVVNNGATTTLTGDAVTKTVATETSTHTVYTHTETLISQTNVDYAYQTYGTEYSFRTAGTRTFTFTTGTNTRNIPREPETVQQTKTVFLTQPVRNTHVRHTATRDVQPVWTTRVVTRYTGTETDYITTATKDAFQTRGTVFRTVATRTDYDQTTSTESVQNLATDYVTTYTGTTTDTVTQTEYEPDWWRRFKREQNMGEEQHHEEKRAPPPRRKRKDDWIDNYGLGHFKSACSCLVTFPLPTRTQYHDTTTQITVTPTMTTTTTQTCTDTDVRTTCTTSTATEEVCGRTKTVTVPYVSTRHVCETVYVTVTVDANTYSFSAYFPTTSVTTTVQETTSGIKTEYGVVDVTKTSSVVLVRTSDVYISLSEGIAETVTDYYDTTVTETVLATSTLLTTIDTTVNDVLTRTIPIEATQTNNLVQTVTIFTDATRTIDVTATETVGVITTSTVLTIVTVGQNTTSTITSTVALEQTISATATATVTCGLPVRNGGFEDGEEPWYLSLNDAVGGYIDQPGYNSDNAFYTNDLQDYRLMELYQDLETCPDTTFDCTYRFLFTDYYEFYYPWQDRSDPAESPYVPYLRVYFNDDQYPTSNRWPESEWDTNWWFRGSFQYTSSSTGQDRIWFDAASPQPPQDRNTTQGVNRGGRNHVLIDSIQCYPA